MQNTSHAVMSQRAEPRHSLDDFPTPPWATRAFVESVLLDDGTDSLGRVLEPACGRGHMAAALSEYSQEVISIDIHPYGYGSICDYLKKPIEIGEFDWVITNPPFRLAEEFILKSIPVARQGVAMLVRTVFIESIGRFERLFSQHPPSVVAQYVERVPMVKGRLDRKASTATGYCWCVWQKSHQDMPTKLRWIPPSRKRLERNSDYVGTFDSA